MSRGKRIYYLLMGTFVLCGGIGAIIMTMQGYKLKGFNNPDDSMAGQKAVFSGCIVALFGLIGVLQGLGFEFSKKPAKKPPEIA